MTNSTVKQESKLAVYYSFFVPLMPIFCIYASGIPGVTMGELLLGIFGVLAILQRTAMNPRPRIAAILLIMNVYFLITVLMSPSNSIGLFVRIIRFMFYTFCLLYTSRKLFIYRIASKVVITVSLLATVYVAIQYIFYFSLHTILKGQMPFLPIYFTDYLSIDYASIYSRKFFRASAFFLEPAAFSQYVIAGLVIQLFKKDTKKQMTWALVFTVGLILSTSIQGTILAAAVWCIWLLMKLLSPKNIGDMLLVLMLLFLIPLVMYLFYNSSFFDQIFSRLSGSYSAVDARFGGFSYIAELQSFHKIIGTGFGNTLEHVWMSSASYIWYGTGLIGIIFVAIMFIKQFFNNKESISRILCLIYAVLFLGAFLFNSYMFVFYMSFICYVSVESLQPKEKSVGEKQYANLPC